MPKGFKNVGIPEKVVERVDAALKHGVYRSRAEFVKAAVIRMLEHEHRHQASG